MSKITTATIRQMKTEGKPITMLTAYDYSMAKLVDEAGIDMILVGDSLANTMLGYDSTLPVTMDEMVFTMSKRSAGAPNRPWWWRISPLCLTRFPRKRPCATRGGF